MNEIQLPNRILVTGGAGFIGSAVVRTVVQTTEAEVINVDKLTYAGNLDSLNAVSQHPNYHFERADVCDSAEMSRIFSRYRPEAVMHLAAESHVDRSIHGPLGFMQTNFLGTFTVLEVARTYWKELDPASKDKFRFQHISTDEVFGDLKVGDPPFNEATPYSPSSPYSASKAASDHLVNAWHRTYGLPVLITNCSNNYGPYQFPEKLIPLVILNALDKKELPIYGDGSNIRDWLFIDDHVRALLKVLCKGTCGRSYNIGGRNEITNLDVVRSICSALDELVPMPEGPYEGLIRFVPDRPGHDRRYAIDDRRIAEELDWQPVEDFASGLRKTIQWYLENTEWVDRVRSGAYRQWIDTNYRFRNRSE